MYGSKVNYETHFFISGDQATTPDARELSGIDTLDIGYQNSAGVTKPLGYQNGVTTIGGPTSQTVSFSL